MRNVLWILLAGVVTVVSAWWLAGVPGRVTLNLAGLQVETSTSLLILAAIVLFVVLLLLVWAVAWLLGIGRRLGQRSSRRRMQLGQVAIGRALVAIAAGDAQAAEKESRRGRRLLGDTPQSLLLAAQSARLAGDEKRAASLFEMLAKRPDAALLGLRGLYRQALAREDYEGAGELAKRAEAANPGAPWVREERARLAVRTGDWRQALALSGPESPRAAFAVAAAESEAQPEAALRLARDAFRAHPDFAPAAMAYARRLRETGKEGRAQDVLREAWAAAPTPDLADVALAGAADAAERQRRAIRLIGRRADHPESQLLMASVYLEAGRLQDARWQLEAARRGGLDQRRVWTLIADLESQERGGTEAGRVAQRDALRRAAGAQPDPEWRCEVCGTAQPHWRPVCPACQTPGRIVWGAGPRPALLPTSDAIVE